METNYHTRRQFADYYLSAQLEVLSKCFGVPIEEITIADMTDDQKHATDVLIDTTRIALRIRSFDHLRRFSNQITVRNTPGRDGKSEWDKVCAGEVRYMLYCFAGAVGDLARWTLIDLRELRLHRDQATEQWYGSGSFLCFDLNDCRSAIVAGSR
jgi:hypothetical protein